MKKTMVSMLFAVFLLSACAIVPAGRGYGPETAMVVPLLPPVVVFDVEPYYYYKGFHYHYANDRWYYAKSRRGPWINLPRDHYPREVRYKNRNQYEYRDRDDDRHERRDNQRYYDDRRRW